MPYINDFVILLSMILLFIVGLYIPDLTCFSCEAVGATIRLRRRQNQL